MRLQFTNSHGRFFWVDGNRVLDVYNDVGFEAVRSGWSRECPTLSDVHALIDYAVAADNRLA